MQGLAVSGRWPSSALTVLDAIPQDPDYPVRELQFNAPESRGWCTPRWARGAANRTAHCCTAGPRTAAQLDRGGPTEARGQRALSRTAAGTASTLRSWW